MLLFLYQDPDNYYRYGAVRTEGGGEMNGVLERYRNGRPELIRRVPIRMPKTD